MTASERRIVSLWREPERPAAQLEWPALQFHDVFKIYRSGSVETVALRGPGGRVATVDLGTPAGVDNVDAYRMIIQSFKWA